MTADQSQRDPDQPETGGVTEADAMRAGVRGVNRTLAFTLIGITLVMLCAAVGVVLLVNHIEALHALATP